MVALLDYGYFKAFVFGIYDVYQAGGKASETQVVYFDGISKQVSNY